MTDQPSSSRAGSAVAIPELISSADLNAIGQHYDPQTRKVRYTTFYIFDDEDRAFGGIVHKPQKKISLEEYQHALTHIPDDRIYPKIDTFEETPLPPTDTFRNFIKRPDLRLLEVNSDGSKSLPDLVRHEVEILQRISKVTQHPHLVRYTGVRIHRGRVTGIVLEMEHPTLMDRIASERYLNGVRIMEDVRSAVAQLHLLDLAHNNINPENIMIDEHGHAVLIEFRSCAPPESVLPSFCKSDWMYNVLGRSDKKNDVFALGKLWMWLGENTRWW